MNRPDPFIELNGHTYKYVSPGTVQPQKREEVEEGPEEIEEEGQSGILPWLLIVSGFIAWMLY